MHQKHRTEIFFFSLTVPFSHQKKANISVLEASTLSAVIFVILMGNLMIVFSFQNPASEDAVS